MAIHAVLQLELPGTVVGGLVGFVGDRRALHADGLSENASGCRGDLLPAGDGEASARHPRIDAGRKENLSGVDVADAGHGLLIEQSDLHRAARLSQPVAKFVARNLKPVWPEPVGTAGSLQTAFVEQSDRAQPAPIPEQQPGMLPRVERDLHPQVGLRGRIGHEHEPRHPRFDHQPFAARPLPRVEFDRHPLPEPVHRRDRPPGEPLLHAVSRGPQGDRPHRMAWKRDARDPQSGQMGDPAAHRLDFGQFGHVSPEPRW